MRDKKHRINSTILLIISLAVAAIIFTTGQNRIGQELASIVSFLVAVLIITGYQTYALKELEHDKTKVNTVTQIYFGILLLIGGVIVILLNTVFMVEFTNALLWMVGIVLIGLVATFGKLDEYLEHHHRIR